MVRLSKASIALSLGVVGGLVGGVMLVAPPFRVLHISVSGASDTLRVEAETIIRRLVHEQASLFGAPRLFLVRVHDLAAAVKETLPAVAEARVLRRLPATLAVELTEKVIVAYLDLHGSLFSLDETGRVFAGATTDDIRRAQLPLIRSAPAVVPVRIGDQVLTPRAMDLLREVIVLLPERLSTEVIELTIPSLGAQEVHVRTDRGWTLMLDGTRPLADQLDALDKVLTEVLQPDELERLDSIDLRAAGKVFFRVRP